MKGQHIGDMVAVTQSEASVFDYNGIFGFIVQGTKVCSDHYQYIYENCHKSKLVTHVLHHVHIKNKQMWYDSK